MNSIQNSREHQIIFTRYPEPGKTKTRLIPALGSQKAAELHRHLAEHTLAQVKQLANNRSLTTEIRFTGSTQAQMQAWLGTQITCRLQGEGDLGERMARAFQEAFTTGSQRVVIIGTDCPSIDPPLLANAFDELHRHDLVLGPAEDGGYYLIGLSRFIPDLFVAITWGTSAVLQQTLTIANQLQLSYSLLPQRADIDRPEDLALLDEQFANFKQLTRKISIIVPVLNETDTLEKTLRTAQSSAQVEIIVADGGSEDGTDDLARSMGVKVIYRPAGRAAQMNAGAAIATGDILLFLHGDTQLPQGFDKVITETLSNSDVIAGAFELRIDGEHKGLRFIETGVNWRSRWFGMPYGDQAIFMPAQVFKRVGGFPEMAIMEDFEMMRRLRRLGKINIVAMPVLTSGRRWQKLGVVKTTLINQLVIMSYFLGVAPTRLARWYRRQQKS